MDGVRLVAIQLDNWKSFGSASIRNVINLAPLTILVGPNASGKSNALDALRFLQGAAFGHPLGDVLRGRSEGGREVWPGIRGGVVEASRSGQHDFALWTCWEGVLASGSSARVTHLLHADTGDDVSVVMEALYKGTEQEDYFFSHSRLCSRQEGWQDRRRWNQHRSSNGRRGKKPPDYAERGQLVARAGPRTQ
jgi:hypothetical protein